MLALELPEYFPGTKGLDRQMLPRAHVLCDGKMFDDRNTIGGIWLRLFSQIRRKFSFFSATGIIFSPNSIFLRSKTSRYSAGDVFECGSRERVGGRPHRIWSNFFNIQALTAVSPFKPLRPLWSFGLYAQVGRWPAKNERLPIPQFWQFVEWCIKLRDSERQNGFERTRLSII